MVVNAANAKKDDCDWRLSLTTKDSCEQRRWFDGCLGLPKITAMNAVSNEDCDGYEWSLRTVTADDDCE